MPLTAATINKSPRGLLSWFGLKSGGQQPTQLSATLIPTLDLRDWYFQTNARYTISAAASAAALGDLVLPGGPIAVTDSNWIVAYTVRATVAAGSRISMTPAYFTTFENGTVQAIPVGPNVRHTGGAASEIVVANADAPFFMPPGGSYGLIVTELVAGPVNVFGYAAYCEIRS